MTDLFVVGVSMTPFGKFLDKSVKALTAEAVTAALKDAGCAREAIGAAFFANAAQSAMEGQYMVGGEIALRTMGFSELPIFNVENACASASTAFNLACTQLRAGECDVALAIGAEKMYSHDKARTFEVFNGAWDVHEVDSLTQSLLRLAEGIETPSGAEGGGARSIFMDVYAALAKQHMARFGTTERQLAAVAAKNHRHSTLNPLSQYRTDMTVEEVLAARTISWPLTLPMCAPISDGAAAAILCRRDMLDRFDRTRAVKGEATVRRAAAIAGRTRWKSTSAAAPRPWLMSARASVRRTCLSPKSTMPRRSPRWCKSKIWAFASLAKAAGSPSMAKPLSAGAFP